MLVRFSVEHPDAFQIPFPYVVSLLKAWRKYGVFEQSSSVGSTQRMLSIVEGLAGKYKTGWKVALDMIGKSGKSGRLFVRDWLNYRCSSVDWDSILPHERFMSRLSGYCDVALLAETRAIRLGVRPLRPVLGGCPGEPEATIIKYIDNSARLSESEIVGNTGIDGHISCDDLWVRRLQRLAEDSMSAVVFDRYAFASARGLKLLIRLLASVKVRDITIIANNEFTVEYCKVEIQNIINSVASHTPRIKVILAEDKHFKRGSRGHDRHIRFDHERAFTIGVGVTKIFQMCDTGASGRSDISYKWGSQVEFLMRTERDLCRNEEHSFDAR